MTMYTIRVVLDAHPNTVDLDALLHELEGYHPAVSVLGRRTEVIISLPAEDLNRAVRTGLAVVTGAHDAVASAVQAMTADEWDQRLGLEPLPELVSVTEAAEVLGVSRQAVLQRLESGSLVGQKVGNAWVIPHGALTPTAP